MKMTKPDWIKIKINNTTEVEELRKILKDLKLNTVCQEANCPNKIECFGKKTATFMILGSVCTRNCTFCNVKKGMPMPVDSMEPVGIAEAVKKLGLKYVVITSVTRDDLSDGGAGHFVKVIDEIRRFSPKTDIEVLIPDFKGDKDSLLKVVLSKPKVINHNIETIKRLYPQVRPEADYFRSLELLKRVKELDKNIYSKSGFMVGLGENQKEVEELLYHLRQYGCDIVTIGQYLPPSKKHYPLKEYVDLETFERYKEFAKGLGFKYVASAPLVRSSYHAGMAFECV